jgi:Lrp/AsnC family transcriptional regulator, regulator for asnA, asnC and gidA
VLGLNLYIISSLFLGKIISDLNQFKRNRYKYSIERLNIVVNNNLEKVTELGDQKTIDSTDEKILRILMEESRTSFTYIAKECHITVAAVRKRYNHLWETGIINGEIMIVNPHSLGYTCIVNIGIITDDEDENKVIEFLKSKPYVIFVIAKFFDRVNIDANICLHEYQELHGKLKEIEANPLIKKLIVRFWLKTSNLNYPQNLVLTNLDNRRDIAYRRNPEANFKKIEIDEIDRQIARILCQTSRKSFTKIAQELNISSKNVIQRYNKLKGSVLISSTITVDTKKLGYNARVHLRLEIKDKSKIPEVADKILKIPNVITVIELVGGDYDLFPVIVIKNWDELFRLKEQLAEIKDITKTTMLIGETFAAFPFNMFAALL